MVLPIFISSLILSLITLIPLGMKWELEKKIVIPSAFLIGIFTGIASYWIAMLLKFSIYHILLFEIFLITITALSLMLCRFYRDPERAPPKHENVILSPADGKIIYIKKIEKGEIPFSEKKGKKYNLDDFTQTKINLEQGYLIGIAMNYLDVHVNRAPIEGRIILLKHIRGLFISLKKKEAVIQNERMLTIIDNGHFKLGIVQIASRLVRKIVPYFSEGQEIKKGERMGIIRFGSQVDLILPDLPSFHIVVKTEEKVQACTSIIASYDIRA